MNTIIKTCHPETHEILCNARAALYAENPEERITNEQYNEIIHSCFIAETERAILFNYEEVKGKQNERIKRPSKQI